MTHGLYTTRVENRDTYSSTILCFNRQEDLDCKILLFTLLTWYVTQPNIIRDTFFYFVLSPYLEDLTPIQNV